MTTFKGKFPPLCSRSPDADLLKEASILETSVTRLVELSRSPHQQVRAAVAKNPNTPRKILLALWRAHGKAILKDNPVLTLWEFCGASRLLDDARPYTLALMYSDLVQESPERLDAILDSNVRIRLMSAGELPPGMGTVFAQDPDPAVRKAFISSLLNRGFDCSTPGSVLIQLANDPEPSVRFHFADSLRLIGNLSAHSIFGILARCALVLAGHGDPKINATLKKCKKLPPIVKKRLSP